MNQQRLFLRKYEAEFEEFDRRNPDVWRLFERFTLLAIGSGRAHYSAEAILQRLRWHVDIDTRSADGFKINDHFRTFYARKFIALHRAHARFFETRERPRKREESR